MKINHAILLFFISALTLAGCCDKGGEMAQTPFNRYPCSDFYKYPDEVCIDSMINESGNPIFVFEDSDHVRNFVELEDTLVIINGYLAPESYYTPDQKLKIIKHIKYCKND